MSTQNSTSFFLKRNACSKFLFAKKLLLLVIFSSIALLSHAQKQKHLEPVNPVKDKQDYQGYTIRLIPALGGNSYGFDIFQGPKLMVHQYQDPMHAIYINKKEYDYKVSTWVIKEYKKTGHWTPMVPPHAAKELKLSNKIDNPSKN
jgi:hypothetical protein